MKIAKEVIHKSGENMCSLCSKVVSRVVVTTIKDVLGVDN